MYKRFLYLTSVVGLVLIYQNCAFQGASHEDIPSLLEFKGCSSAVGNVFVNTYYPVFRSKCVSCHDTGAGFGHFANSDIFTAFNAFESLGRGTVEGNFLNAAHQPGHTGPENQFYVDSARPLFEAAEAQAAACSGDGSSVTTNDKTNASIWSTINAPVANGTFSHLEWNLETDVSAAAQGRVHLILGLDVRMLTYSGGATPEIKGYEFKNLTGRLVSGSSPQYELRNITILLNRQTLDKVTAYSLLDATVNSVIDQPLIPGAASAPAVINSVPPVATTDMFALRVGSVLDASGQPIVVDPNPNPTTTVPATVRFADLISTNSTLGVFRNNCFSCHSGAAPAAGLNLSVYSQALNKAANIKNRMNNAAAPMPPSGMLGGTPRLVIDTWINSGTPQ